VKGPGQVTKWRKEPDPKHPGQMISVPYKEDAILATRKTHLTELPEAGGGDEGEEIGGEE
jgi:hypothetical protein